MLNLYKYYDEPDDLIKRTSVAFIDDVVKKIRTIVDYYEYRNQDEDPNFPDVKIDLVKEQSPDVYTIRVRSEKLKRNRIIVVMMKHLDIFVGGVDMQLQSVSDHEYEDGIDDDTLEYTVYDILNDLVG